MRNRSAFVRHFARGDFGRIRAIFYHVPAGILNGIIGGDARDVLYGDWDLIIAHPPCTFLTISGNKYFNVDVYGEKAKARQELRTEAVEFFMLFVNAPCEHIAIENPIGCMSSVYRKPDQIYNPFDFAGETECKRTCLWLKNLPKLIPNQNLDSALRTHNGYKAIFDGKQYRWNSPETAKLRSRTPWGVARAMAEQWGEYLLKEMSV